MAAVSKNWRVAWWPSQWYRNHLSMQDMRVPSWVRKNPGEGMPLPGSPMNRERGAWLDYSPWGYQRAGHDWWLNNNVEDRTLSGELVEMRSFLVITFLKVLFPWVFGRKGPLNHENNTVDCWTNMDLNCMVPLICRLFTVINTALDLWLIEFQYSPSKWRADCNLYSAFQLHPTLLCRSRANYMLMVIQSEK